MKELLAPYGIWPMAIMAAICCLSVLIAFGMPYKQRPSNWMGALMLAGLVAIVFGATLVGHLYIGITILIVGALLMVKYQDHLWK